MRTNYEGMTFETELYTPALDDYSWAGIEVVLYYKGFAGNYHTPPEPEEFVFTVVCSDESSRSVSQDEDIYNEYDTLVNLVKRFKTDVDTDF